MNNVINNAFLISLKHLLIRLLGLYNNINFHSTLWDGIKSTLKILVNTPLILVLTIWTSLCFIWGHIFHPIGALKFWSNIYRVIVGNRAEEKYKNTSPDLIQQETKDKIRLGEKAKEDIFKEIVLEKIFKNEGFFSQDLLSIALDFVLPRAFSSEELNNQSKKYVSKEIELFLRDYYTHLITDTTFPQFLFVDYAIKPLLKQHCPNYPAVTNLDAGTKQKIERELSIFNDEIEAEYRTTNYTAEGFINQYIFAEKMPSLLSKISNIIPKSYNCTDINAAKIPEIKEVALNLYTPSVLKMVMQVGSYMAQASFNKYLLDKTPDEKIAYALQYLQMTSLYSKDFAACNRHLRERHSDDLTSKTKAILYDYLTKKKTYPEVSFLSRTKAWGKRMYVLNFVDDINKLLSAMKLDGIDLKGKNIFPANENFSLDSFISTLKQNKAKDVNPFNIYIPKGVKIYIENENNVDLIIKKIQDNASLFFGLDLRDVEFIFTDKRIESDLKNTIVSAKFPDPYNAIPVSILMPNELAPNPSDPVYKATKEKMINLLAIASNYIDTNEVFNKFIMFYSNQTKFPPEVVKILVSIQDKQLVRDMLNHLEGLSDNNKLISLFHKIILLDNSMCMNCYLIKQVLQFDKIMGEISASFDEKNRVILKLLDCSGNKLLHILGIFNNESKRKIFLDIPGLTSNVNIIQYLIDDLNPINSDLDAQNTLREFITFSTFINKSRSEEETKAEVVLGYLESFKGSDLKNVLTALNSNRELRLLVSSTPDLMHSSLIGYLTGILKHEDGVAVDYNSYSRIISEIANFAGLISKTKAVNDKKMEVMLDCLKEFKKCDKAKLVHILGTINNNKEQLLEVPGIGFSETLGYLIWILRKIDKNDDRGPIISKFVAFSKLVTENAELDNNEKSAVIVNCLRNMEYKPNLIDIFSQLYTDLSISQLKKTELEVKIARIINNIDSNDLGIKVDNIFNDLFGSSAKYQTKKDQLLPEIKDILDHAKDIDGQTQNPEDVGSFLKDLCREVVVKDKIKNTPKNFLGRMFRASYDEFKSKREIIGFLSGILVQEDCNIKFPINDQQKQELVDTCLDVLSKEGITNDQNNPHNIKVDEDIKKLKEEGVISQVIRGP